MALRPPQTLAGLVAATALPRRSVLAAPFLASRQPAVPPLRRQASYRGCVGDLAAPSRMKVDHSVIGNVEVPQRPLEVCFAPPRRRVLEKAAADEEAAKETAE